MRVILPAVDRLTDVSQVFDVDAELTSDGLSVLDAQPTVAADRARKNRLVDADGLGERTLRAISRCEIEANPRSADRKPWTSH